MSFTTAPKFTAAGRQLQLEALAGAPLIFTAIKIGDGALTSQAPTALTDLVHPVMTLSVENISIKDGFASIRGSFSNSGLAAGFYWREVGVFARLGDGNEALYCYANAYELAEYIAAAGSEVIEKIVSIAAVVGDAPNVTAIIDESLVFATREDLDALRHVITVRERDPTKPDYGMGGGDARAAVLETAAYSGTAEVAVDFQGKLYDAKNMRINGENVPDGTMILTKMEE